MPKIRDLQLEQHLAAKNSVLLTRFYTTHKLNKNTLADMIGVTGNAIDHWETGRRDIPPPIRKMLMICDKYAGLVKEFSDFQIS